MTCQHGEVFDSIVIGTGFAGAVTAARLVQAGQRICVLERGRKFGPNDFPMYPSSEQRIDIGQGDPKAAPDLARWFWSVDQGLYDIRDLDDVLAVQAAGYGGGSLIYANVHLRAPPEVFLQGWPKVYRRKRLDPFYDLAAYMLEVQPIAQRLAKTEQLQRAAVKLNRTSDWFRPPLAVRFGPAGTNRWNREQGQCDMRGQCWLGCRAQAKNTLNLNYLAIVEDARGRDGRPLAEIRTLVEARKIERASCECGAKFVVHCRDHLVQANAVHNAQANGDMCCAKYVFLCAGAVNSTDLLLCSKDLLASKVSRRVGSRYHPNADSLAAVFDCDEPQQADFGPTITSALLYHGPRQCAGKITQASPRPTHDELSVVEFATHDTINGDMASRLQPDARIHCNATGADQGRDGAELRLVEAPLFDFGGYEADSQGVLVVAGDGRKCRAGDLLFVGGKEGHAFGTILAKPRRLEDWFLIEDGGYPTDIEPLLGIMRSPLWMRRNRYIEHPPPAVASDRVRPEFDTAAAEELRTESARQMTFGAQPAGPAVNQQGSGRPLFPLATAIAAFRGITKRPVRITVDVPSPPGDPTFLDMMAERQPFKDAIDRLLPEWLRNALNRDRTEFAESLAPVIERFLDALFEDLAEQLGKRIDVESLASSFGSSLVAEIGTLSPESRKVLIRGLLRQGMQVLWGSDVALAQRMNNLLLENLPQDAEGWANLLALFLGWLLQYREGNGRTAILLIMGRDQFRGCLRDANGRLVARLPSPLAASVRLAEEGVLRDIAAKAWHGELRTNPAWTFLKRRITVHSQGGCPMSSIKSSRVTEYTGEVIGCPGLYVMDAAAFPTAVGVNPSATIMAVAEYKIARFIKKELRIGGFPRVPSDADVAAWVQRQGRAVLDPIDARRGDRSPPPVAPPLGLEFEEGITGFLCDIDPAEPLVDWLTIDDFDGAKIASFDAAERRGTASRRKIEVKLTASIGDLDRFLQVQRQGRSERVKLTGEFIIDGGSYRELYKVLPEKSFLQLFVRPRVTDDGNGSVVRFFRYRIVGASDDRTRVIEGAKVLRDDPQFDVWYDLSTLYFDVFDQTVFPARGKPLQRGIMRLALDDFVERQLRSITITPENADPARKSWAYFAFVQYYGGEVARIYVSKPHLVKDFLKNVLGAAHGN
jgi:choline dehydrogenase-like flavoprotein